MLRKPDQPRWIAPARLGGPAMKAGAPGGNSPPAELCAHAALHEFYPAAPGDAAAAIGFAAAAAALAAGDRFILWVCEDIARDDPVRLHPSGLAALGLDPALHVLVRARSVPDVLRAGVEAARCGALGAAVIEVRGEARQLDLTASRRLSLAAQASGVPVLMVRLAAHPVSSAAWTRWLVRSAPSRALAADAPGCPAYDLTLLRHRGGVAAGAWRMEWDRDRRCFEERTSGGGAPLSRGVVSVPADRPPATETGLRRAV